MMDATKLTALELIALVDPDVRAGFEDALRRSVVTTGEKRLTPSEIATFRAASQRRQLGLLRLRDFVSPKLAEIEATGGRWTVADYDRDELGTTDGPPHPFRG